MERRSIMNTASPRTLLGLACAACLALAAVSAGADTIYRWVDEHGVVNYTQQKPRGKEAVAITTGPAAPRSQVREAGPVPVSTANSEPLSPQQENLSPQQEKMLEGLRAAEAARQEEIAKIKAQNCQRSRDVLSRLTLKNRIRIRGEDGEYRIMPEEERQRRIAEAQENIARYCAPA